MDNILLMVSIIDSSTPGEGVEQNNGAVCEALRVCGTSLSSPSPFLQGKNGEGVRGWGASFA